MTDRTELDKQLDDHQKLTIMQLEVDIHKEEVEMENWNRYVNSASACVELHRHHRDYLKAKLEHEQKLIDKSNQRIQERRAQAKAERDISQGTKDDPCDSDTK